MIRNLRIDGRVLRLDVNVVRNKKGARVGGVRAWAFDTWVNGAERLTQFHNIRITDI